MSRQTDGVLCELVFTVCPLSFFLHMCKASMPVLLREASVLRASRILHYNKYIFHYSVT